MKLSKKLAAVPAIALAAGIGTRRVRQLGLG